VIGEAIVDAFWQTSIAGYYGKEEFDATRKWHPVSLITRKYQR
jgi:hypothetical protein